MVSEKFIKCDYIRKKWEGVLSNDKYDKGGITKYGLSIVTLKEYARNHPISVQAIGLPLVITPKVIENITKEQADLFFYKFFWQSIECDNMPIAVACCVYDFGVNSGQRTSVKKAQIVYNKIFSDRRQLVVDGIVGPLTISAMSYLNTKTGINLLCEVRRDFVHAIVSRNSTQGKFLKGWLNRINDLNEYALKLI